MNDSLPFSPYYKLRVLQIGLIKQQLSLSLSLLSFLALSYSLFRSRFLSLFLSRCRNDEQCKNDGRSAEEKIREAISRRRLVRARARAKLHAIAEAEGFRRIIRQANYEVRNKRLL